MVFFVYACHIVAFVLNGVCVITSSKDIVVCFIIKTTLILLVGENHNFPEHLSVLTVKYIDGGSQS